MTGAGNIYAYVRGNPVSLIDPTGLEWQVGLGLSGALFGAPAPGGGPQGGFSGSATVGISTDGTLGGTQIVWQYQGALLTGAGVFAGAGPTVAVSPTDGPVQPGYSSTWAPHVEFNVGLPAGSGSGAIDFDMNMKPTGIQGMIRGPNIGPGGVMGGGGMQGTVTIATPTGRQIWEYAKRRARELLCR